MGDMVSTAGSAGGADDKCFFSIEVDASKLNGAAWAAGEAAFGTLSTVRNGTSGQSRRVAISRTKGDFSPSGVGCVSSYTQDAAVRWTQESNPAGVRRYYCQLEKTGTYYINVTHLNTSGTQPTSCTTARPCGLYYSNSVNKVSE